MTVFAVPNSAPLVTPVPPLVSPLPPSNKGITTTPLSPPEVIDGVGNAVWGNSPPVGAPFTLVISTTFPITLPGLQLTFTAPNGATFVANPSDFFVHQDTGVFGNQFPPNQWIEYNPSTPSLFNQAGQWTVTLSNSNSSFPTTTYKMGIGGFLPPSAINLPFTNVPYTTFGIFFNGSTGIQGTVTSTGSSKISFAGWFRSAWTDPNPPLFITDPGPNSQSNNDPQVEAVGGPGGFNNILLSTGNQVPFGQLSFLKCSVTSGIIANAWVHLMGSVDGSTGQGAFLVNGIPLGTTSMGGGGPQPFANTPTNGKQILFGMDGLNDFYTGDIADLSVWFDVSWLHGGVIPSNIVNAFITPNGRPVNPSISVASLLQLPNFFLTGPASRTYVTNIITVNTISPSAGAIGDSSGPTPFFNII